MPSGPTMSRPTNALSAGFAREADRRSCPDWRAQNIVVEPLILFAIEPLI